MRKIYKSIASIVTIVSIVAISLTSCSKEPDESSLYELQGMTIYDFLVENQETTSSFISILKRTNYDRLLSTYGEYTCFAPNNIGVARYADSLYDDAKAKIVHNGISDNYKSLRGSAFGTDEPLNDECMACLTDSLCKDIVEYHLLNEVKDLISLSDEAGVSVNTILNRVFSAKVDTARASANYGKVMLNKVAAIISADNELLNGTVHLIDNVMPRSSRLICDELKDNPLYSIFSDALQITHIADSLEKVSRGVTYDMGGTNKTNTGELLYYPKECRIGYTIFAETDEVFAKAGINNFEDLKAYCVEKYKDAASWYDYVREKGITISTGDDYENPFNVVNMFVRYHIVNGAMNMDKLIYKKVDAKTNANWNFAFGGEPYDYFETLLPHTLIKVWQPLHHNTNSSTNIWINRYRPYNTLTDEVGSMGSEELEAIRKQGMITGVQIVDNTDASLNTFNGYVHRIRSILLYDRNVPEKVLNERLRFDVIAAQPELATNGIRGELNATNPYGSNTSYFAYPLDFFDNIKCYNSSTHLLSCTPGPWRCWESDQLQGWGLYDFAIRIPSVPSGVYEVRIDFPAISYGGMMQFYIGTSSRASSMQAVGLPFDIRIPMANVGWTNADQEPDYGVESDAKLRSNGYMRCPCSFSRGTYNSIQDPVHDPSLISGSTNCRTEGDGLSNGNLMARRIITTMQFNQSEEYWFRLKSLINDDTSLKWFLDFIELVPVTSVVNSMNYSEDWY